MNKKRTKNALEWSDTAKGMLFPFMDHIESQVTLAIGSATLLIAANMLVVGIAAELIQNLGLLPTAQSTTTAPTYVNALIILGFISLVLALLAALFAIFPKITLGKSTHKSDASAKGVFFFGSVGSKAFSDFVLDFKESDSNNLLELELLHQIHQKSQWLRKMFYMIRASVACTGLGALLLTIAIIISIL